MSYQNVLTALDTQLQTVTGLPTFTAENYLHEPVPNVAFTRSTFSPAETAAISNGSDLLNGLYLVDVFYPSNRGATSANAMAEAVLAVFQRGQVLTETGTVVHITKSWREVAQILDTHYRVQVVVRWESEHAI